MRRLHTDTFSLRSLLMVSLLTVLLLTALFPQNVLAASDLNFAIHHETTDSGNMIYLEDRADLLSAEEETALLETMRLVAQYGHVAFVSITENPYHDTAEYADEYYYTYFSYDSGTVFLVDMDERMIYIHSNGEIEETITTAYANTITDNVYTYASEGDFYTCANTAFEQIHTLLLGKPIAQPMKYISNALLAIVLALLINYFIVMASSHSRKASTSQLLSGTYTKVDILNPTSQFVHQTKRYSPVNRSSGSSSGGARSGGGGGGGSRGSGGGHRF